MLEYFYNTYTNNLKAIIIIGQFIIIENKDYYNLKYMSLNCRLRLTIYILLFFLRRFIMKKYDERETLFARVALQKDTAEYEAFYKKNPLYKDVDDKQRGKTFLNALRKSDRFKSVFGSIITHNKLYIKTLFDMANKYSVNADRKSLPPSFSKNLKEITKYFGAADVGIANLTDYSYYSHQGGVSKQLGLETLGKKVLPRYKRAIVYTVPMDKDMINTAPRFEELLATEEAYIKVANIGARLTMYLKDLGYKAVFNNSEYYLAPMVPLAFDAGLGQIGMANHIVTKEHGNRVRLGAVFTTLEVDTDKPIDFGLTEFCKKCALCLQNCPSQAITHKQRIVNGRPFYKFDDNACYQVWLKAGTDCGTCLSACPFSQGLDQDKVNRMKDEPELMDELLQEHYQKHGRRVYIKEDLPIVRLKDE
jgi:epoxyqueuosine reductase QueG